MRDSSLHPILVQYRSLVIGTRDAFALVGRFGLLLRLFCSRASAALAPHSPNDDALLLFLAKHRARIEVDLQCDCRVYGVIELLVARVVRVPAGFVGHAVRSLLEDLGAVRPHFDETFRVASG